MTWELHRHDARRLSGLLDPGSVDLIVTSPPYFALRSYRDGGEHYDGQLGSEATPGEFVDNLIACTRDWMRVMRPGGSIFVNLGDKFAGSGGHNNSGLMDPRLFRGGGPGWDETRNAPKSYNKASDGVPNKSRMGLPWRYAIRCIDELGLHLRADIIWHKLNGLPESVQDRVRISHEYLFHFTLQPRYYAAIDEVREAHSEPWRSTGDVETSRGRRVGLADATNGMFGGERIREYSPLGKVPGSVWAIASEPLTVPDHLGVDHFAAFPSELPRRCILGWSPTGRCTECGEGRVVVVVASPAAKLGTPPPEYLPSHPNGNGTAGDNAGGDLTRGWVPRAYDYAGPADYARTGYGCACNLVHRPGGNARVRYDTSITLPPTRPAVVVDPFCGTGTTVAVAHHLGRHGIGTDLSSDYLRLAEWRVLHDRSVRSKVRVRSGIPDPRPPRVTGQLGLFGDDP